MSPAFFRKRAVRVVNLALMCFMLSPFTAADDYAFLHDGPADVSRPVGAVSLGSLPGVSEDFDDSHHVCSCVVCAVALGESFSPEVVTLPAGELMTSFSVRVRYASHLPDIFKPPIA